MRTIILCILTLSIGMAAKAQSNTASLSIFLSDVQSVTYNNTALNEVAPASQEGIQSSPLQVFSQSASQVKEINSTTLEYERLYKEFYSGSAKILSNPIAYSTAGNRAKPKTSESPLNSTLVIYQIDPR